MSAFRFRSTRRDALAAGSATLLSMIGKGADAQPTDKTKLPSSGSRNKALPGNQPKQPITDPCFTDAVLAVLGGLSRPTTPLQRRLREQLDSRVLSTDASGGKQGSLPSVDRLRHIQTIGKVASAARRARSQLGSAGCAPMTTAKEFVAYLKSTSQAFQRVDNAMSPPPNPPFPEERFPPRGGTPFFDQLPFEKDCLAAFVNDLPMPLAAREQMKRLGATTNGGPEQTYRSIASPHIGRVDLEDTSLLPGYILYSANVKTKSVERYVGDVAPEFESFDYALNPPPANETDHRLVLQEDPDVEQPNRQIMLLSAAVGQRIRLSGSGFLGSTANVLIEHRSWLAEPQDGMLVPFGNLSDAVREPSVPVDVHGGNIPVAMDDTAQTYTGDSVIFDWNFSRPGLYRVRLYCVNRDGNGVAHQQLGRQTPLVGGIGDLACSIRTLTPDSMMSNSVWIAILPRVAAGKAKARIVDVVCTHKTRLFGLTAPSDHIRVNASMYTLLAGTSPQLVPVVLADHSAAEASRDFDQNGQRQEFDLNLPGSGFSVADHLAEVLLGVNVHLYEGIDQRERVIVTIIELAVLLLIIIILADWIGNFGTKLIPLFILLAIFNPGFALALTLDVLEFAIKVLLPALEVALKKIDEAIWIMVEREFGARLIVNGRTEVSMAELFARGSPWRYYRRLFDEPRGGDWEPGRMLQKIGGTGHGGAYDVKVEVRIDAP